MGVRENKVETYLDSEVKRVFNGITRKWVSPGHDGVPDRILIISCLPAVFVEVKTTDGDMSDNQIRELKRLRDMGSTSIFTTVYGQKGVDGLINFLLRVRAI